MLDERRARGLQVRHPSLSRRMEGAMMWRDLRAGDVVYHRSMDTILLFTLVEEVADGTSFALYYDLVRARHGQMTCDAALIDPRAFVVLHGREEVG
jgi:hypothetical protein